MEETTLDRLLLWCANRINQKDAMNKRFGVFLEVYGEKITFDIIKVTGTNGKGSVCSMLSSCLKHSGKKVGLFTSPHLVSINERFRINDEDVPMQEVEAVALELEEKLKEIVAQKGDQATPSFFEVLVLTAILLFHRHKVDIAIFEAGIGGANDSTSLLPERLSVITSIGLDHQKQLGETLEEIATDKAGIASKGTTLIINSAIKEGLKTVIKDKASGNNVRVLEAGKFVQEFKTDLAHTYALAEIEGKMLELEPSLLGHFQQQNLNLIIEVWLFLKVRGIVANIEDLAAVRFTRWVARFEVTGTEPTWILDSAHNSEAFEELISSLERVTEKSQRLLLFGNSEEKDFKAILKLIPAISDAVYFVDNFHKAIPQATLVANCENIVVLNLGNSQIKHAVERIKSEHRDKIVVVAGSIFMIGEARAHIKL